MFHALYFHFQEALFALRAKCLEPRLPLIWRRDCDARCHKLRYDGDAEDIVD